MKSKSSWRIVFALSIILYAIAVFISIKLVEDIPTQFVKVQKENIVKVENKLIDAVANNNISELDEISEDNYIDFVVYDYKRKETIYSTIEIKDPSIIKDNANSNIVAQKKVIDNIKDKPNVKIWYTQYYDSPQSVFDIWIKTLFKIMLILLAIVVIIMIVLFNNSIKPLRRLKDNIVKISSFHLDEIKNNKDKNEYDALSKELYNFSLELERNIKETGQKYSSLEKDLQIKNNAIVYKNRMLGSLSHDLKAPLSIVNLSLEKLNNDSLNKVEREQLIKDLHIRIDNLVEDINNINKLSYEEKDDLYQEIKNYDLIKIMLQTLREYDELFDSKDFYVEIDTDESILINGNEIRMKQLIRNALSNIYNYASQDAYVKIECYKEEDIINIKFYNDGKPIPEDQLGQMFNLFYTKSDSKYSTGTGMYTIKTIVEELESGEVDFINKDDGVELDVQFKN